MQFRIGDRDPETGLYNVIWPDGSSTRNGIKIFNAAYEPGDIVAATRRSDGLFALDSVKAIDPPSLPTFGEGSAILTKASIRNERGYLQGQVFNNEEEDIPVLSIEFAPESPEELARGQGSFVVRISVRNIQNKDLDFYLELSGTAIRLTDYTTSFDPEEKITLLAGQQYKDIIVTPSGQIIDSIDVDAIVALKPDRAYKIAKPNVKLAIKRSRFGYKIHKLVGYPASGLTPRNWIFTEFTGDLTTANLATYEANWIAVRTDPALFMYDPAFLLPTSSFATDENRVDYPDYPIRNKFALAVNHNSDYGLRSGGSGLTIDSVYREDYDVY